MRPAVRRYAVHPGVLDAEFLLEEGNLVAQAVDLGPAVPVVRGPGDQGGERVVAQSQDMEDRRLHPALPAPGERESRAHGALRDVL